MCHDRTGGDDGVGSDVHAGRAMATAATEPRRAP